MELEPETKRIVHWDGLWRHLSYFTASLQTEPLNTLIEQQQRLFKTQRYLGAGSVFSVWPKG